jgi:hypothetical protein
VGHVGTKVGSGADARIDRGVKSRLGTGIRAVGKACDRDNETGSEYCSTLTIIHTCHQGGSFSLHHGSEHETQTRQERTRRVSLISIRK